MKRMLNWIKSWFGISLLFRKMSSIERRIEKLQKIRSKSDNEIEKHLTSLDNINDKFIAEYEKTSTLLKEAAILNQKLEATLEATNEELKTANEILIPGLIAANKILLDRWDEESAIHAMRIANMGIQKEIE